MCGPYCWVKTYVIAARLTFETCEGGVGDGTGEDAAKRRIESTRTMPGKFVEPFSNALSDEVTQD